MPKKRILFCEIYDDGTVGGSHSILFNLVSNLDQKLFDLTVGFLNDNIYVPKLEDKGIRVELLKNFESSRFPNRIIRKLINWYRLIWQKTQYLTNFFRKNNFDLVVINNTLYTSEPYIKACKKLEIPIIIYERGINKYSAKEINLSGYVSVSIPMSDAIYKSVVDQGVKAKKIIRIYDGINEKEMAPTKSAAEIRKEFNIPEKSKIIGIIGNVKPWKGQEYFVKAMIKLCQGNDDIYALIAGAWKEKDLDFKKNLDKLIEDAGFSERIIFTGYRTDVANILSILHVFVHASTKPEPFGMVVPEAMAAKVPVIATNFGGPVESLDHGSCGILVEPKNEDEIYKACLKYILDEHFRISIIKKAYVRFEENFTLSKTIELTTDILLKQFK